MTVKKKISRTAAEKNDGKKNTMENRFNSKNKNAVKYTFERTKEDIENIERVRRHLNTGFSSKYQKADSKIYRDLPDLYLNAVKTIAERDLAIDELTAKLRQLEDLRASFCRILELCDKTDDESSEPPEAPRKNVAKCANLDPGDDDCKGCDGYNTDCDFYDAEEE